MGALQPVDNLIAQLTTPKMMQQIEAALPRHLTAERMLRVTQTALRKDSKLAECSAISVVQCVVEASQLGLEPNSPLQQCYLIPYRIKGKFTCQLQIGYRGWLDLVDRTGNGISVSAEVVYQNDAFSVSLGTARRLEHTPYEPKDGDAGRGALRAVYAVCEYPDGR